MIDTSASMTLALDFVKEGAEQFLIRMLPEDVGMVGAFNDKIQFIPRDEFTGDRDFLIRSLKDLDFGYPTRLYDAVDESIDKLKAVEGGRWCSFSPTATTRRAARQRSARARRRRAPRT
jgi:hypothetical protein